MDKDLEELELRLEPTVDVELQIQWPTGVTQKITSVTLSAPDRFFVNSNLLTSAGDSGFRIANLGRDRYPVTVYGDKGPVGIKAVQMNGADLPGRLLDLTQGAGPVTIVVASETGEIIGKVEDQKSNAAVALLSDAAGPARLTYASLDSSGAYSFKGLAPGEYKVAVVDERDYPELSATGSLGVYEVAAKKVTLAGKDTLTVDLK